MKACLYVAPSDRTVLERLAANGKTAQKLAIRARIVLLSGRGFGTMAIAREARVADAAPTGRGARRIEQRGGGRYYARVRLDARLLVAVCFVDECVTRVKVSDATFADAKEVFSLAEIVEMTLLTGFYMMVASFLATLAIDPRRLVPIGLR
jgi:hypothetical protein